MGTGSTRCLETDRMSMSVGAVPPITRLANLGTLGVVTGLAMEAALIPAGTHPRLLVDCAGPGPEAAAKAAWRLMEKGCDGLVSFGTAGGLDPALPPGALILATEIHDRSEAPPMPTDATLRAILREARTREGMAVHEGALLGSDSPIQSPEEKAQLFQSTGALAVDMESHRLAEIAQDAGLPFLAVRAVADPAHHTVPDWAMKGVDAQGQTRVLPILLALLLGPWRIPALITLARDSAAATATLEKAAKSGFPL